MRRSMSRAIAVGAAVGSLGLLATTAYGEVVDARERAEKHRALVATVSPAVQSAEFAGGGTVTMDVREYVQSERRGIPYRTLTKQTRALAKGTRKVARAGVNGVLVNRWLYSQVDGHITSRQLASQSVVRRPITKIVLVGTYVAPKPKPKPKPVIREKAAPAVVPVQVTRKVAATAAPKRSTTVSRESRRSLWPEVPGAEYLNWAALAQCESSGNPRAVNSYGPYYGLYQFLASTWRSVGGTGLPSDASAAEQTYRAKLLYARSGAGQWPVCGKRL